MLGSRDETGCVDWEGTCLLERVVRMRRVVRVGGSRWPSSFRSWDMVVVGLTVRTVLGRPPNPVTRTLIWETVILRDGV